MRASRETLAGGKQLWDWAIVLLLSIGGFELTAWLAGYSGLSPIVAYLMGFFCVVVAALASALRVPEQRTPGLIAGCAAAGLMLAAAFAPAAVDRQYPAICVLTGLLILGTGLGAFIGRRIQAPSHLLFVALVSGVADTLSVTQPGGISKAISDEPAALALLALPWPMLGTRDIAPFLGVTDVIFASLYIHATRLHGLSVMRTLGALCVGFAGAVTLVVLFERPIPVLPLLGACFLAAQPRARAASRRDLRRGVWVLAALAGVIAAAFLRRAP